MLTLDDLGRQTITAFRQAIPASNIAFYRINTALETHDFILHGIVHSMHDAYLRRYRHIDPLKPSCCVQSNRPVLSLRQAFDYQSPGQNARYQKFLARYGVTDVAEVLIHYLSTPVAGLSLLRRNAVFDQRDLNTLRAMHQLTELSVNSCVHTQAPAEPDVSPPLLPALTPREQDIVQLACQGLTNKQIARRLDIGDATVKTHLMNVYEKHEVHSRIELVLLYLSSGAGYTPR